VLAVVGSDAKAAFVRERGAEVVINRNSQDIVAAVNEATDGQGVDAVYDAVGAATIEQSLRATRDGGTCILYGGGSGPVADLPESLTQRLQFKRTSLATHLADEHAFRSRMGDLFEWYRSGQVVPHIAETWPLDQAAEALKTIATGDTVGKLLIRVRPEG
ncbi:MAG: zinc-binding dehydrogenase, partial [Dehalococcoidia bacterium]